jgi:hypothetical protein
MYITRQSQSHVTTDGRSVSQSVGRSVNQSISQSVSQSVSQGIESILGLVTRYYFLSIVVFINPIGEVRLLNEEVVFDDQSALYTSTYVLVYMST